MKRKARWIENALLTFLLLGGMIGIYLYAGRQEQLSAAENTSNSNASETSASESSEIALPVSEISGDGRLRSVVLSALSDAGYTASERDADILELFDAENQCLARVLLASQGERVRGLTLQIPLPEKPETQKKPTLIEQALLDRYETSLLLLKESMPQFLADVLSAIDPYETVPSTARLYWQDLLIDAVDGDRSASDASQPIRMKLYESTEADETWLCLSLEIKS